MTTTLTHRPAQNNNHSRLSPQEEEQQEILHHVSHETEPPQSHKDEPNEVSTTSPDKGTQSKQGDPAESVDELKREAQAIDSELLGLSRKTLETAIRFGKILIRLKKALGHGKWASFIHDSLKANERTLSNYRRLAENEDVLHKSEKYSEMGIVEALKFIKVIQDVEEPSMDDSINTNLGADNEVVSPQQKEGTNTESTSPDQPAKRTDEFRLADGSMLSATTLGWSSGFIERSSLNNPLSNLANESTPEIAGTRQRIVIELAGKINEITTEGDEPGKQEHLEAALKALLEIVSSPRA